MNKECLAKDVFDLEATIQVAERQYNEGQANLAQQSDAIAHLGATVDNEFLRSLEIDPASEANAPNRQAREVQSGHFVLVRPTPLPDPVLVAVSEDVCGLLLLNTSSGCGSPNFIKLFSGGSIAEIPGFSTSWATPYALSIYGQEVCAAHPLR